MGPPDLNRRHLLATAGGLAVAGSFGFAALGAVADALASNARTRVRYWNRFSGGDGGNCTKLAMAAAGSRAPDLAVMHQGRVPGFTFGRYWLSCAVSSGQGEALPNAPPRTTRAARANPC